MEPYLNLVRSWSIKMSRSGRAYLALIEKIKEDLDQEILDKEINRDKLIKQGEKK